MRVFISYASEDRNSAEQIHLALVGAGIQTFFDKQSLPAGGDFSTRIQAGVNASDLFVFLISPDSITKGSYALTELHYARLRWPHPKGRVLPVIARDIQFKEVPPYLGSVTILEPEGNLAAEVVLAISAMADDLRPRGRRFVAILIGVGMVLAVVAWVFYSSVRHRERKIGPIVNSVALTDQEPAAGGLLVDVDPLTVTWQAHGQPEDIRVSLESLVGALRTDDIRAISSEGLVRFPAEFYHKLLTTREKDASNRLRAIIRSRDDSYTSQPADVRVGLRVLTLADTDGVTVAAMIDNQRVANYDFEARVVVPPATPGGEPLRIGPNIPYRFRAVAVRRSAEYDWSAIKAVYLGPDDPRVVRLMYLVDDALKHNQSVKPPEKSITYDIIFDGGSPNPAHGFFTFDSSTRVFTSFEVTWQGRTFNFLPSANHPVSQNGCTVLDAAALFSTLTGGGQCNGLPLSNTWRVYPPNPVGNLKTYNLVFQLFTSNNAGYVIGGPNPDTSFIASPTSGTFRLALVPQ